MPSRRSTLNPPTGHAVTLIPHEAPPDESSTEKIRRAIDAIRGKKSLPAPDADTAH